MARHGTVLTTLGPKSYIGEIVCLTGDPALGTATLTADSHLFSIPSDKLQRFVTRDGDIAEALESSIVHELAQKVVGAAWPPRDERRT